MMDFYFFVKTFVLTLLIVLALQIEIDKKTVETHVHDWMVGSLAAGFLGNAAHGGAHFLHDATKKITDKMKENIGAKHRHEIRHDDTETKASSFHWGWEKTEPSTPAPAHEDVD